MKRLTIILLFIVLGTVSYAQQISPVLTDKHKQKLEQVKDPDRWQALYKKYLKKDSAKWARKLVGVKQKVKRKVAAQAGELKQVGGMEINTTIDTTIDTRIKDKALDIAKDSLSHHLPEDIPTNIDSAALKKQAKKMARQAKRKGKKKLENQLGMDVPDIALDTTATRAAKKKLQRKGKKRLEEEAGVPLPEGIALDSAAAKQAKNKLKEKGQNKLEEQVGVDLPEAVAIDSTTTDKVKDMALQKGEGMLKDTEAFKALDENEAVNPLGNMESEAAKLQQLQQDAAMQQLREKMAGSAKQYIAQHADKIQAAQSKMQDLKKKYSYMPNSNDLSTAVKRTSLKNEPFWKRLVLGGNINITQTNPLGIDLSPVIGYKINKLFEAGLTGTYRAQFKGSKQGIKAYGAKEYGYGIFANHMVFRNFFGYLEGQRMRLAPTAYSENTTNHWEQALLIGIGRQFRVAKWLEMQALVLFNVLHDNGDGMYNAPVVFKTGFRIGR